MLDEMKSKSLCLLKRKKERGARVGGGGGRGGSAGGMTHVPGLNSRSL